VGKGTAITEDCQDSQSGSKANIGMETGKGGEMKHTPEPWDCGPPSKDMVDNGYWIRSIPEKIDVADTLLQKGIDSKANAERIISCVNALAGLEPEAVRKSIELITNICEIMKQQHQKDQKGKGDKYLSVYYRACLENAERFLRIALKKLTQNPES